MLFCFAILPFSIPGNAGYSASGQFCQLVPAQSGSKVIARCDADIAGNSSTIELLGVRPNHIKKVRIRNNKSFKITNTIIVNAKPLIGPETVAIMIVDANFDGLNDFAILKSVNSGNESFYDFYIFFPDQNTFERSLTLSHIANPDFDIKNKLIKSYWKKGNQNSGWNEWTWQNNKLVLTKVIEQSNNSKN